MKIVRHIKGANGRLGGLTVDGVFYGEVTAEVLTLVFTSGVLGETLDITDEAE